MQVMSFLVRDEWRDRIQNSRRDLEVEGDTLGTCVKVVQLALDLD